MIDLASASFGRTESADSQPDCQTALDFVNRALYISPDDPVALFHRAIVYQRMHLYNRAIEDWRHYLRVDPKSKWADEAGKRLADVEIGRRSTPFTFFPRPSLLAFQFNNFQALCAGISGCCCGLEI